jgi:imidazoleglycerol phosphate dehydratase HisB
MTTTAPDPSQVIEVHGRRASVVRTTRETKVSATVDLDGSGVVRIATGVGFWDHLLGSLAHHGLFDLEIHADGDVGVDEHHTVEDVALVLGSAVAAALGDRAGISRFGDIRVPMDESLARSTSAAGPTPSSTCRSGASVSASSRSSSSSTRSRPLPGRPGRRST